MGSHWCIDAWVRGLFGSQVRRTHLDRLGNNTDINVNTQRSTRMHIQCILYDAQTHYMMCVWNACFVLQRLLQPLVRRSAKKTNTLGHQWISLSCVCSGASLCVRTCKNARTIIHASLLLPCGRMFWNIACVGDKMRLDKEGALETKGSDMSDSKGATKLNNFHKTSVLNI